MFIIIYKIEIMSVNSSPRITVLMAIYNCAPTLVEALDSLMGQTYQRFKVVLCDDCSTDNTYEVARKYIGQYPDKFILIRNDTNRKLPYSLNRCLEYADTEYVARMDGDDISKPERFEKEIKLLDEHPEYALVSCPIDRFDESGVYMCRKSIEVPEPKDFLERSPFCHAPVMIRTKALRMVQGYTDKKWTQRGQDFHLWAKLMAAGFRGYNIQEPLYLMRDSKDAFKRRTVYHAIMSIRRHYEVYSMLGLSKFHPYKYSRAILVACLPYQIYKHLHRWKSRHL